MTSTPQRDTTVKRDQIKDSVRNALWARTAGRCTSCNRRLLGDNRTYLHSVLLAELAHNVGATDGSGSPRGDAGDDIADVEGEDNLLLLCHDCHKIIDDPDHLDFFPPERLREIKESFERWIEMVTEIGGLTRTAALRVGSRIRGSFVIASQREVAATLFGVGLLGLVETRRSGDFTCRISGSAGGRGFWDAGQQKIDDVLSLVDQAVATGDVEHLSIFAIAPIPLLVYLGYRLDDKTPTRLFQKSRDVAVGWSWSTVDDTVEFELSVADDDTVGDVEDVVLVCAVSSPVNEDLLPAELAAAPRIVVGPSAAQPSPTLVACEESLANFALQWRQALATAETRYPGARRWHLVASAPVSIAVETGRALMRDAHPAVTVYERVDNSGYRGVLDVNTSVTG